MEPALRSMQRCNTEYIECSANMQRYIQYGVYENMQRYSTEYKVGSANISRLVYYLFV